MACSGTVNTRFDTSGAEVVVATVTDAAVEVFVFHWVVAAVAVHDPGGARIARLGAECETGIGGGGCEVVERA